jgi:hypothetical protein
MISPGGKRWRLAWVLPLAVLPLVVARASGPIRDNGFLWHIRAGTVQLEDGRVLTADPFSFTALGSPWRTQSWMLELAYGWLELRIDTLSWANWFVLACGTVAVLGVGIAALRRNRSPIAMTFALVVFAWLLAPFAQPRPVIASYALLALIVVAVTYRERLTWVIPVVLWIFAAVHGTWILGLGVVLLESIRTRDRRLAGAGAVGFVLTLFTAHGIGTWRVLVDFANSSGALDYVQEWFPPDFGDVVQAPYLLIVAAILVAAARGGIQLRDLVIVGPFLLFGLLAQRTVVPAAIVLLPWAVTSVPPIEARVSVPRAVGVAAAAVILAVGMAPMFVRPLGQLAEGRFPDRGLVDALPAGGVYHGTLAGGYLIYDRWPDLLVYIDDRAELYGTAHFDAFERAMAGDYREEFLRWSIDTALIPEDSPLARQLAAEGWRRVAADGEFVLFVSDGGADNSP